MRWKTYAVFRKGENEQKDPDNENKQEKYGFRTLATPPQVEDELSKFESRLYDMITDIDFNPQSGRNSLTKKMNDDIKRLQKSDMIWVRGDKTNNFYEVDTNTYSNLLSNSITPQYKKCQQAEEDGINTNAAKIAKELHIEDRTKRFSRQNAFITLKDHKDDFRTKPSARLINRAKADIGKVSKQILDRITKDVRNARSTSDNKLIQWKNTAEVLKWFREVNKNKAIFIQFDIEQYYPSISETLLKRALEFARQYTDISESEENIIMHSKRSLLFCDNDVWQKKDELFDVTMSIWDGAETSDIVGLYLLGKLLAILPTGTFGLYRDDGLTIIEDANGPKVESRPSKMKA